MSNAIEIARAARELTADELANVSGGGADTSDTVRKAGSGTTSGGGVYLRYTFGTVFTTATR